ncbi:MAG: hypothetical protein ACPG8W_14090, partial [Candidatus Promineifilaceae bacterium]
KERWLSMSKSERHAVTTSTAATISTCCYDFDTLLRLRQAQSTLSSPTHLKHTPYEMLGYV